MPLAENSNTDYLKRLLSSKVDVAKILTDFSIYSIYQRIDFAFYMSARVLDLPV